MCCVVLCCVVVSMPCRAVLCHDCCVVVLVVSVQMLLLCYDGCCCCFVLWLLVTRSVGWIVCKYFDVGPYFSFFIIFSLFCRDAALNTHTFYRIAIVVSPVIIDIWIPVHTSPP
jgi:hypothetical protein